MLSGGGRTALNLFDAIDQCRLNARIVGAIASRPCAGVDRLAARGIAATVMPGEISAPDLHAALTSHDADLVALCGYMRFVHVPPAFAGRIINIHPALLPRFGGKGFYGHHVHEAVIEARETISGCTVHVVDNEFDHGPIILQKSCPVLPTDTPDSLAARVFELELLAYPEALQLMIDRLVSKPGAAAPSTAPPFT
jgi:phosphoribosylglycinamide formyltransferase-1